MMQEGSLAAFNNVFAHPVAHVNDEQQDEQNRSADQSRAPSGRDEALPFRANVNVHWPAHRAYFREA